MIKFPQQQKGVVILYALLIIALITAIGIGVSIVIVKELRLTQNTHFATMAYYAAESGVEKALHTVKIFRQDPTKELDSNNPNDTNAAIPVIRNYAPSDFVNDAGYDDSQTKAEEEKVETKLGKDQFTQVDLYDTKDPAGNPGIESLMISWSDGDETNADIPWLEISYVEWSPGSLDIPNFFDPNAPPIAFREIHSVSESPLPLNFPASNTAYRVRIKALYDEASNLIVTAYNCDDPIDNPSCNDNNKKPIPARVLIKSVGKMGEFEQAITALVPWNAPLFGLYDYVLYSEGQIEKKIIVGKPIYTSGAIQVESALTSSCTGPEVCPRVNSCPLWKAVCCAQNASCTFTSETGTCKLDNINSTHWVLPTPSYVQPAEKYYLSIRANYTGGGSSRNMQVILGDTCKNINDQMPTNNGWVSCTLPKDDFTITPNVNIMFKQNVTGVGAVDVDWYQLSTYKIFDDCIGEITDCTATPICGDCLCSPGELSCSADAIDCVDNICYNPKCDNGCDQDIVLNDQPDPGQCASPSFCCGGECKTASTVTCDLDSDCPDPNPGDACIEPQCNFPGQCAASCGSYTITTCDPVTPDGCCNTAYCDFSNDIDCAAPLPQPNYEYLRYVAIDENNIDLTSLHPTTTTYNSKSQRVVPVWQDRSFGANFNYRAVHAADATHLWAAGEGGKIVYSGDSGQTWTDQSNGSITTRFSGIWSYKTGQPAPDDYSYFVVGNSGSIYHCHSGCTTSTPSLNSESVAGVTGNLNAINGIGVNNIWAVGDAGTILFYNGTVWAKIQNSQTANILYGIWAYDSNNVWAVGAAGTICYCGSSCGNITSTWNPQTSNSTYILTAISGTDTNHIWISAKISTVGSQRAETILYSANGINWTKPGAPDDGDLWGVSSYVEPVGANPNKAVFVGSGGNTFYCENSTCTAHTSTSLFLTGITKLNRAAYAYNWQNMWIVGNYQTANEPGVILYGNAPGQATVNVSNGYDQYWLSGLYSSLTIPAGNYTAYLNVLSVNVGAVSVTPSVGYCDNAAGGNGIPCDEAADFKEWYRASSATSISTVGFKTITIQNGVVAKSCSNCRFYSRLQATANPITRNFNMAVAGRDAGFATTTRRNSYVDVP